MMLLERGTKLKKKGNINSFVMSEFYRIFFLKVIWTYWGNHMD